MHKSLRHLRSRYGITPEKYLELFASQKELCAGCGKIPKSGGRNNANSRLFVDHNHKTGDIRGLLCQPCNAALGLAQDSPQILRSLAQYLERKPVFYYSEFPLKDKGSKERAKTHCPKGHPYDLKNTYNTSNNWRQCKICRKVNDKKRSRN